MGGLDCGCWLATIGGLVLLIVLVAVFLFAVFGPSFQGNATPETIVAGGEAVQDTGIVVNLGFAIGGIIVVALAAIFGMAFVSSLPGRN